MTPSTIEERSGSLARSRDTAPRRLRRQPPVGSPFTARQLLRACRDALGRDRDPREDLAALLRSRFHADHVQLYDSGTSALAKAIAVGFRRAGRGPVALPAFTCYDVATAAIANEAGILFYDLDPETLDPDPASFLSALRRGARVVVVSHLFGFPVSWEPIRDLARNHGAFLVEDAAQGHGAYLAGRPLGSLGDVSVLSFGRGKGWTGGRGGALLFRTVEPSGNGDESRSGRSTWTEELRLGVGLAAQLVFGRPSLYWIPASVPWLGLGETAYRPPRPPSMIPGVGAALVLHSRTYAARAYWGRRRTAHSWRRAIPERPAIRHIRPVKGAAPGYLRYPLLLSAGFDGFSQPRAARRLGIERSYPAPLFALPEVRTRILHPAEACPGAEELARRLVTLPSHELLSPSEVRQAAGLFGEYGGRLPHRSPERLEAGDIFPASGTSFTGRF